MELAGLLCGCGGGVLVLLMAAALLRLAVMFANRLAGPVRAKARGGIAEWDWDDWDDEDDAPARPARGGQAIPEPGIGTCTVIVFAAAFVAVLGFVLLGFAAEGVGLHMRNEGTRIAVAIVDLPLAGLALTVMLVALLPTTFWRAAMVAFLYVVLLFALCLFVGVGVFMLTALLG